MSQSILHNEYYKLQYGAHKGEERGGGIYLLFYLFIYLFIHLFLFYFAFVVFLFLIYLYINTFTKDILKKSLI